MSDFKRYLPTQNHSFFLLGPRETGKSTWIEKNVSSALTIDLLETDRFLELSSNPAKVRHMAMPLKQGDWIVIDEIQKIPGLLEEVHWAYQKKKLQFAITGSSARKLKKT
jgi:predicted AAA+ superfamily ATPase